MDDVIGMEVVHGLKSLSEELECLGLWKNTSCILVIEKVPFLCILEDKVKNVPIEECFPKTSNVWMVYLSMQLDLSLHQFYLCLRR